MLGPGLGPFLGAGPIASIVSALCSCANFAATLCDASFTVVVISCLLIVGLATAAGFGRAVAEVVEGDGVVGTAGAAVVDEEEGGFVRTFCTSAAGLILEIVGGSVVVSGTAAEGAGVEEIGGDKGAGGSERIGAGVGVGTGVGTGVEEGVGTGVGRGLFEMGGGVGEESRRGTSTDSLRSWERAVWRSVCEFLVYSLLG